VPTGGAGVAFRPEFAASLSGYFLCIREILSRAGRAKPFDLQKLQFDWRGPAENRHHHA